MARDDGQLDGQLGDGTRAIHAGMPKGDDGTPLRSSPVFASTYHLSGEPHGPYQYGRLTNPTWSAWEAALGELEAGEVVSFSSGIAAVSAVLQSTLRPGDVLVMADDCYYATRRLAQGILTEIGVEVRLVPSANIGAQLAGAKLVWLESPSNPKLDVSDIEALSRAAHAVGAALAVDNTTATALGQQPLVLGADYSVASDTKALAGHSDLVLGHVACREAARADAIRTWRSSTGGVPGVFEAWLAHRSLMTLDLRLARQGANALALAELLATHRAVASVRYPWLPGDPSYDVAVAQMRRPGRARVVHFGRRIGCGEIPCRAADRCSRDELRRVAQHRRTPRAMGRRRRAGWFHQVQLRGRGHRRLARRRDSGARRRVRAAVVALTRCRR